LWKFAAGSRQQLMLATSIFSRMSTVIFVRTRVRPFTVGHVVVNVPKLSLKLSRFNQWVLPPDRWNAQEPTAVLHSSALLNSDI
jgi:hypothetical protein